LIGGAYPDEAYGARRTGAFIIAVNCTETGETCFCASMGTDPRADTGYDLVLTELIGEGRFLAEVGTGAGAALLDRIPREEADEAVTEGALAEVAAAADRMGREMPEPEGLRDLLAGSLDAARWDDVASRCLTCGNRTMVCPTCFCTTVEDVTDLTGEHAERRQRWDSCFDLDFSHLPGGSVRTSGKSRYRQWLTHKLGTWHDQFGSSGCVGCGRCIVWCPVGIDLTEEVAALREEQDNGVTERLSGSLLAAHGLFRGMPAHHLDRLACARTPGDLLYATEMADWRGRGVRVEVTVDRARSGWDGQVGLITTLVSHLDAAPDAVAFVRGPEIMMRLTARELLARGIDDVRISLERNMRCGIGWCGHYGRL
jgi:ferredoxin